MKPTTIHRFFHDLESILYVLFYMLCKYTGPNGRFRKVKMNQMLSFMQNWFFSTESDVVGLSKHAFLTLDDETFEE